MSFGNFPNFFLDFSEREMNGEEKHFYQFKSFRLDVKERQLLHHNLPVALTPKVFDVLVALVERGGHLVEKDELLKLVWADSFVEEINVARSVHALRKVLGEDENGNKFIETVAKKGYRFVAKVTEVSEPSAVAGGRTRDEIRGMRDESEKDLFIPHPSSLIPSNPPVGADGSDLARAVAPFVSKPKQNTRIILFAVGFLSAIFLIGLLSFNYQSSSTNPNKIKSIAVLPIKPINTANRDEIYEVGIADSLILRLGSMKGFVVRPLSATRKYADIEQDALAAGREQKVDYVLASNYQIADGKIRITAQLFNVSNGQIEETYKSEKNANNIFATQDAIAGEVGNILSARFNAVSNSPAAKRGTTNEEAYRLHLQGRNLTFNRTGEAARKAVEYFEQAIKLDPNYALAYSGMAHAFIMSGNLGNLPRVEYEQAKQAVTTALELDNNLAEGYAVRGELKFTSEWDFAGAEKDLLRAVELEPNSDLAHERYAFYLAVRGRFDDAIAESKTAQEINPNSLQHQQIGAVILYLARRYTEAVTQFKQIIEVDENHATAYSWLFLVFDVKGDDAAAYEWFLKNQKRTNSPHLAAFQTAYETSGWQGVRLKNLEFLKQDEGKPAGNYYRLARQCVLIGDKEQSFEYLNKAVEKRHGQMVMLNVEPAFDALRDDPRFDELVRRIGLK